MLPPSSSARFRSLALAAVLLGSGACAFAQGKPMDDAELSDTWGQALLDLTNTTQGGFEFSRITLNADITMSSSLQRPGAGHQADGMSDIDITTLNFGRSDSTTRPAPSRSPTRISNGSTPAPPPRRPPGGGHAPGLRRHRGRRRPADEQRQRLAEPHHAGRRQVSGTGTQLTSLTGCRPARVALNPIGGVTAGNTDGASRDFFLSVLKTRRHLPDHQRRARRVGHRAGRLLAELDRSPGRAQHHRHRAAQHAQDRAVMRARRRSALPASQGDAARRVRGAAPRRDALAAGGPPPAHAAAPRHAMRALADDELAAVRGADGIAFNLNNFSLTSSLDQPADADLPVARRQLADAVRPRPVAQRRPRRVRRSVPAVAAPAHRACRTSSRSTSRSTPPATRSGR